MGFLLCPLPDLQRLSRFVSLFVFDILLLTVSFPEPKSVEKCHSGYVKNKKCCTFKQKDYHCLSLYHQLHRPGQRCMNLGFIHEFKWFRPELNLKKKIWNVYMTHIHHIQVNCILQHFSLTNLDPMFHGVKTTATELEAYSCKQISWQIFTLAEPSPHSATAIRVQSHQLTF